MNNTRNTSLNPSPYFIHLIVMLTIILASLSLTRPVSANPMNPLDQIPKIPAFLPMLNNVPASDVTPIDGEWMVNTIGKRIRIQAGRAYAVDPWLHLFVLQVNPLMVVIKDIKRVGPGQYVGQDLPLMGSWQAQLTPDGSLSVNVAGALGPANYILMPITQDDRNAYNAEKSGNYSPDGGSEDDYDEYPEDDGDDTYPAEDDYGEEDYTDDGNGEDDYYDEGEEDWEGEEYWDESYEEEEAKPRKVEALKYSRYSCKGKGLYYSKVNGVKACYKCPDGMKRTKPTRKMDHPKACVNREGKNTYAKAKKLFNLKKCTKGQFKHKGYCKACPEGTKRMHIAGLDNGYCKVLN